MSSAAIASAPSQWPKVCPCCGLTHTAAQWQGLRLVGVQHDPDCEDGLGVGDGVPCTELRDCACRSTLAVDIECEQRGHAPHEEIL